jgi:hypothetical protein
MDRAHTPTLVPLPLLTALLEQCQWWAVVLWMLLPYSRRRALAATATAMSTALRPATQLVPLLLVPPILMMTALVVGAGSVTTTMKTVEMELGLMLQRRMDCSAITLYLTSSSPMSVIDTQIVNEAIQILRHKILRYLQVRWD